MRKDFIYLCLVNVEEWHKILKYVFNCKGLTWVNKGESVSLQMEFSPSAASRCHFFQHFFCKIWFSVNDIFSYNSSSELSPIVSKQHFIFFFCSEQYLLTLQLCQSDLLDIFNGISFLPLDKNTYLRIQCFINSLESNFPRIKHTVFMYNDSLVW